MLKHAYSNSLHFLSTNQYILLRYFILNSANGGVQVVLKHHLPWKRIHLQDVF